MHKSNTKKNTENICPRILFEVRHNFVFSLQFTFAIVQHKKATK